MITHVIKLRTVCTARKLSIYITRFFKNGHFESSYYSFQLKFYTANNIYLIGEEYLLNIKKDLEIKSYKFYINQLYLHDYLENHNEKIEKIVFTYVKRTKSEYLSHIKNIKNNPTA